MVSRFSCWGSCHKMRVSSRRRGLFLCSLEYAPSIRPPCSRASLSSFCLRPVQGAAPSWRRQQHQNQVFVGEGRIHPMTRAPTLSARSVPCNMFVMNCDSRQLCSELSTLLATLSHCDGVWCFYSGPTDSCSGLGRVRRRGGAKPSPRGRPLGWL